MTGPSIIGAQQFHDDDGSADPHVREKLDAYSRGSAGDRQVLAALAPSRLLVPVVAMPAETEETEEKDAGEPQHDKTSEVALPLMIGEDGRRAVLAFTSTETMRSWREDARPVPVSTVDACRAAIDEGVDAWSSTSRGRSAMPSKAIFSAPWPRTGRFPTPRRIPRSSR